jgi:hypothetical protein
VSGRPELRFRERMRGWVSFDYRDYNTALLAGRGQGLKCCCKLAVEIDDLDEFFGATPHVARLRGTVSCPSLGTLTGEEGSFKLFVQAPDARRQRIQYRLFLNDADGRELTFSGFKLLEDDRHYDVWRDTTRLLVRLLKGHVDDDDELDDDPRVIATGQLRISALGFMRTLASMLSSGLGPQIRYQSQFIRGLKKVYWGPTVPKAQFDFPAVRTPADRPDGSWHRLPENDKLERRIVDFDAGGFQANLHNIRDPMNPPERDPVLLIGGLSMRANSFYGPPSQTTLVDALVAEGYDVWIENWRTSIDFPPSDYTLDEAAAFDHPAAVRKVCAETGSDRIDAVAHCMGSASLTMSVLAGLVPQLRTVVASAVSLHIRIDRKSRIRLHTLVPVLSKVLSGTDSQWAARAPSMPAAAFGRWATLVRREYDNRLVAAATYVFGDDENALWQRSNMSAATLDWVAREFGYAPFTLFKQMRKCSDAGNIVPVDHLKELPESFLGVEPPQQTSFTFLAGTDNRFFLPNGQRESYEYFEKMQPGAHHWVSLEGYGHYDVLAGRNAAEDVFPHILEALDPGRTNGA